MEQIILAVLQLVMGLGTTQQLKQEEVIVNTYIVSAEPVGIIRGGVADFPGGPITVKTGDSIEQNLSTFISSASAYLKNQTGLTLSTTPATASHIEVKNLDHGIVAYFSAPMTGKMTAGQIITKQSIPKNFSPTNRSKLNWALEGFPREKLTPELKVSIRSGW